MGNNIDIHKGYHAQMYAPPLTDPKKAKALLDGLAIGMTEAGKADPVFQAAIKSITEMVYAPADYLAGRVTETVRKAVNSSVAPISPTRVVEFRNLFGEDDIDNTWQAVYAVDSVTDAMAVTLNDMLLTGEASRLKSPTESVPRSTHMSSTWEVIRPEYYGVAQEAANVVLRKDPLTRLNDIILALRIKLSKKRTSEAFTNIQAGISAANSASYVTAFGTDIPTTLNAARYTLAQRSKDKGYELSPSTPYVLLANEALEETIERYFRETNNIPFGTVRVNRPISRYYTNNLAATLGISGTKALLVLPQRKCRMGIFDNIEITTWQDYDRNAQVFAAREAYTFTTDETQFQLLNLA